MASLARQPRETAFRPFVEADLRFHQTLWTMSKNEYIERVAAQIGDHVQMALTVDNARSGDLERIAAGHIPLVDAIARQDAAAATDLMRFHLQFPEDDEA